MVRGMVLAICDLVVGRRRVVRPSLFGHDELCNSLETFMRTRTQGIGHARTHLEIMKVENFREWGSARNAL
jgi:hypothetical protein